MDKLNVSLFHVCGCSDFIVAWYCEFNILLSQDKYVLFTWQNRFSILMTRQSVIIIILIISYSSDVFVLLFSPSSPKYSFNISK